MTTAIAEKSILEITPATSHIALLRDLRKRLAPIEGHWIGQDELSELLDIHDSFIIDFESGRSLHKTGYQSIVKRLRRLDHVLRVLETLLPRELLLQFFLTEHPIFTAFSLSKPKDDLVNAEGAEALVEFLDTVKMFVEE